MRALLPPEGLSRYQALALVTVALTLALIAVGALVRTTGSGLGCPDWPLCHGRVVPPLERTAIIEYSHRTLAAVVGMLIVATSAVTLLTRREDAAARTLALAALPLLGLQAWLGKVTVERELPPEVVTLHLATALLLLGVLSVIAVFARLGQHRTVVQSPEHARFARSVVWVGVLLAAILLGGAYVVGSGSTTACTTWPGCSQAPLPFLDGGREQAIHWFHRLSVLVGLGAVGWLVLRAEHLEAPAVAFRVGARTLMALYGLQVLAGGLNIWSKFATASLVLHLALAAAIWATLVAMLVAGRYSPGERETTALRPSAQGARPSSARAGSRG